ncbi:hypothetical protein [Embleya sp. NBC_00896]|uniref:hypothetical protein n=1 Tax=Embleya sp. NBC_00896 TaxID=2975961 RepID=UPI002F916B27|nr:hypothetical protein OG928_43150 [Embleya sp. NBC_00896]
MNSNNGSRRRLRSRTVLAAIGAAAVVAVGGVAFASGDDSPKTAQTETAQTETVKTQPAAGTPAATSNARVVDPAERVDLGNGNTTWLADGYHWISSASSKGADYGKSVTDGRFFPADSVDLRVFGAGSSSLYTGAYHGDDKVARVTVEVAGQTLDARILTLAGDPGWSAYYVDGPAAKMPERKGESVAAPVKVYAADGTVLATTPGTAPLAK